MSIQGARSLNLVGASSHGQIAHIVTCTGRRLRRACLTALSVARSSLSLPPSSSDGLNHSSNRTKLPAPIRDECRRCHVVEGCDCFTPGTDKCCPIALDPTTGDIACTGAYAPTLPCDCVIIADGTSLSQPTANQSDPDIPASASRWCVCRPVPRDGACCIDLKGNGILEPCIITTSADCAAGGGLFHRDGTALSS